MTGVDPAALTFTPSGAIPFTVVSIQAESNAFKADGDGFFDIRFDFIPPDEYDKFSAGEAGSWVNSAGAADLNPEMFIDLSVSAMPGGTEGLYTAAHIQGIGPNDDGSGWITVPAPNAVLLGIIGLGLIGQLKRRLF